MNGMYFAASVCNRRGYQETALHFFLLLRTSKILPSLNVLILRAYFSLKCSYFVLIRSSCHKCFTRLDLMKSKVFVVYVNIVHIESQATK